jgi:hypothetical protein
VSNPDQSARLLPPTALAAVMILAARLLQGLPLGIPGEWVWGHSSLPANLLPALLAGLLLLAFVLWLARLNWANLPGSKRAINLALLVLLVFVLQISLINAVGAPWISLGSIIISPNATTYFSLSLEIKDVRTWVASYPDLMSALPYHARTHPPGLTLFFYGVRKLLAPIVSSTAQPFADWAQGYRVFGLGPTAGDATAAFASALLIALLGALSLVPIYLLCRELMLDRAALFAALLVGTLPSLLLLSASPDLILLFLASTTLWLSYLAWKYARPLPAFLAGLVLALSAFLSFGLLAVGLWLALLAFVGALRRPDRPAVVRTFAKLLLAGLAGFALVHLALYLLWDYHPLAVARQAFSAHRDVTVAEQARTYWKWVLMNPVECAVFAGLPLVLAALWAIPVLRRDPELRCLNTFLLATAVTFALLDLSGTVRGEVGRIWLFLFWPLAMAAAPALERSHRSVLLAIVILQLLQALLLRAHLILYSVL